MKNIVLKIAYDGTHYMGWQKTATGPSIEQELEVVLVKILQHPIALQAASRTDRGVHAEGQVVNFFTSKETLACAKLLTGCNGLLPEDIRVLALCEAPSFAFHPTLETKAKSYRYKIATCEIFWPFWRTSHWHFPFPLDISLMKQAAELLLGTHDFKAFQNYRKNQKRQNTIRTVSAIKILMDRGSLEIEIYGTNFLYKMVRNIVGALVYVGCGKMSLEGIAFLLSVPQRSAGAITAPAHGLTLSQVFYDSPLFCNS